MKIGSLLAGAAIGVAALAITAGTVEASPYSGPKGDHNASALWVDISQRSKGSIADAKFLADQLCSGLRSGMSEGEIIAMGSSGDAAQVADSTYVLHAVEWHYCPEFYRS